MIQGNSNGLPNKYLDLCRACIAYTSFLSTIIDLNEKDLVCGIFRNLHIESRSVFIYKLSMSYISTRGIYQVRYECSGVYVGV